MQISVLFVFLIGATCCAADLGRNDRHLEGSVLKLSSADAPSLSTKIAPPSSKNAAHSAGDNSIAKTSESKLEEQQTNQSGANVAQQDRNNGNYQLSPSSSLSKAVPEAPVSQPKILIRKRRCGDDDGDVNRARGVGRGRRGGRRGRRSRGRNSRRSRNTTRISNATTSRKTRRGKKDATKTKTQTTTTVVTKKVTKNGQVVSQTSQVSNNGQQQQQKPATTTTKVTTQQVAATNKQPETVVAQKQPAPVVAQTLPSVAVEGSVKVN